MKFWITLGLINLGLMACWFFLGQAEPKKMASIKTKPQAKETVKSFPHRMALSIEDRKGINIGVIVSTEKKIEDSQREAVKKIGTSIVLDPSISHSEQEKTVQRAIAPILGSDIQIFIVWPE